MTDELAISLWDRSAEEPVYESPLEGDVRTDLAIVGAGFTGLSTALHAAEMGVTCHVLEAKQIGFGGSGRNVGLVNAGLWLPPQDIKAAIGEERGAEFVRVLGGMPAYVFSIIARHQIRCEATQSGTIHAAHAPSGYNDLARRAEEWQRLGAPVDLLDAKEVAKKVGSEKFHGGLLDRRAGTINPMGYVRGLARAAKSAGARISTGVAVKGLRREGRDWVLETNVSPVRARMVVLGTNAYSDALWPGLKSTFTNIHYFQLATEPLGERAATILSERQGLWDTGTIMFSLRRDRAGRILIGSMGKVIGSQDGGLSHRWAQRSLRHLFPALGKVNFEAAWHGQIAMTPNHLPSIHRLADGVYTPIGYNGRGITTGTMFGRAMAELAARGNEEDLLLNITDMKKVRSAPLMSRLYQATFTANQIWNSL
ncbi:MAG: NAD(P)/FAD-dependent oxidoreductase [Hyphomicrobiaceae bacterium]